MMKSIYLLLAILFFFGCGSNKKDKRKHQLAFDLQITELNDSTLLSKDISSICCFNGEVAFVDYSAGNIIVLDENMTLKSKFGKRGEGPGEIISVIRFFRDDSSFYLLDEGSRTIKRFSASGEYLSSVSIPREVRYAPWAKFVYAHSQYYLPNIKGCTASVIDDNGNLVKPFGNNSKEEVGGNVLLFNGEIWSIGVTSPIIENYATDGTLIKSFNYGDIQIVKECIEASHNSGNSFMALVKDACLDGDKLYILVTNEVLCFSLDDQIELETEYLLPHGFYNSIAVNNEVLYGINSKDASVDRFDLSL